MIHKTLAHYRITAKLGEGGMGEVYRATDPNLGRDVAIKVLPAAVNGDKESLARFEREAKALAQLNHPHVASVHGFDQCDGQWFLVLELVEGEDLSARLKRSPLPVSEALDVGRQIAEALEAAHDRGIIHRDLKPGNIKLTSEGKIKVLDFGLAKMGRPAPGDTVGADAVTVKDVVVSSDASGASGEPPALTAQSTQPGVILGTAAYMSPEQARGNPVDKRSDIWSFGVVLFECLTGRRAFGEQTLTDTIGAVLHKDPDWSVLPEKTPPTIRLLLRRCLAKDRRRRLPDIAAARIDLEEAIADPENSVVGLGEPVSGETPGRRGSRSMMVGGGLMLACLTGALLAWYLKPGTPSQPAPIRRVLMDPVIEGSLARGNGVSIRISPDGSTLAYLMRAETEGSRVRLFLRRFDQEEPVEMPAATNAVDFCFAPDGQWIAFRREGEEMMEKASISAESSSTIALCRSPVNRGLTWTDDGWIIIGNHETGLTRISASAVAGTQEPLTTLMEGEKTHRWPQALPGGMGVLFTAHSQTRRFDEANIMVQRLRNGQPDGKPQLVQRGGYAARYLPTGYLVYIRQGTLYGAAFDLASLTLKSSPIEVLPQIAHQWKGGAQYDISTNGCLVYLKGGLVERFSELEWLDRNGDRQPLPLQAADYGWFRLSPDGRKLAYSLSDGIQSDIWVYELDRKAQIQVTTDPAEDNLPIWTPNGEGLMFNSERGGTNSLCWKRIASTEEPRRLLDHPNMLFPWSWHPDGHHLVISQYRAETDSVDLFLLSLDGDDRTGWKFVGMTNLLATRSMETAGSFSPDGRWLAYVSDESGGEPQVFVEPWPTKGTKKLISVDGWRSSFPLWTRQGHELIFATSINTGSWDINIFAASNRVEGEFFIPHKPTLWNGGLLTRLENRRTLSSSYTYFDLYPDGTKLLVRNRPQVEKSEATFQRIALIEGFFEILNMKAPVDEAKR